MKKIMIVLTFFILGSASVAVAMPFLSSPYDANVQDTPIGSTTYSFMDRSDQSIPSSDTWSNYGYTGADYTGVYLGTVISIGDGSGGSNANDSATVFVDLIGKFLGGTYSVDYTKYKYVSSAFVRDPDTADFNLTISTSDGGLNGSWVVQDSGYALDFYVIKGSNEFALYYVDPAKSSGMWTTRHLLNSGDNVPAISHLSASVVPDPVPEPATMLLFGTGLIGLAGIRLRKKNK